MLFIFFVHNCHTHPSSSLSSYADDFTSFHSSPDYLESVDILHNHLSSIESWPSPMNLSIAPHKSSLTLFTPQYKQSKTQPQIIINNTPVPLEKEPKILGVTFDIHFSFSMHVKNITKRANFKLKVLKALACSSWGHQKETMLNTYQGTSTKLISYPSSYM